MKVKVKRVHPLAILPVYAKPGDACFDLHACVPPEIPPIKIIPGQIHKINIGLAFEIPEGYVGLIFARSGLGSKGLSPANCVGVVDSGYRGEVSCFLLNSSQMDIAVISHGDRIAQMMIIPHPKIELEEVQELSESERGEGGFGSTGLGIDAEDKPGQ